MTVELQPLPFEKAIEFFRSKANDIQASRCEFGEEHVAAFRVAGVARLDVLDDIRAAVDRAISEGVSLDGFKAEVADKLRGKGWLAVEGGSLTPYRVETIYRTNLQSAYAAGRYLQQVDAAWSRPWWMYDALEDGDTRPAHLAQDGTVRRFDDAYWETWYPPNGYRCRCSVRALKDSDLARRNLRPGQGSVEARPDRGFEFNPGQVRWQPDLGKYSPEGRKIAAGFRFPRNSADAARTIGKLRDGVAATGVEASVAEISVTALEGAANAASDYASGRIEIAREWLDEIEKTLAAGEAKTKKALDALEILTHESGHLLGRPLDISRYGKDVDYTNLAEAVNDLWARHNLPSVCRTLGIKFDAGLARQVIEDHPSINNRNVLRLRTLLGQRGLSEARQRAILDKLNLEADPGDLDNLLWKEMGVENPGISFAAVLRDDSYFGWLSGRLSN